MDTWKPSTALGAVALALFVTAVTALTGTPHEMAFYGELFLVVFSFVMFVAHLGGGAIRAGLFVAEKGAEVWSQWFYEPPAPPSAPVAREEPAKDDYDAEAQAWRIALDRFFRAGDAAGGFSAGKLSGVAGSDSWPRLVHFYSGEAGGNVLRDAGGNVGHTWGHGWTLDRVMLALGNSKLPHPDMPLPVIELYVAPATQRRAARKSAEVVNGTAKAVD